MPSFVVAALITAGVATGVAVAAGTIAATALTWATIGSFFLNTFATVAIIGGVSRALQKSPRGDPAVQSAGRTITVRQAISPWEAVLGKCRKGGILTFRYISEDKRFWHMIITVAGHRCQAIDEVWLNDEVLALDANGQAQGKWVKTTPPIENVHQTAVPGSPFQITVPTTVTAVSGVFLDQYSDGVFWPCQDVSPATPTALLQFSRSGNTFTFHSGAQGKTAHIRTFNSTENSHIRVKISLGDEGTTTQPFPDLVAESNGRWTNDHKQYGHTKVYIRLEANPELFPFGVPNFSFVVRGAADVLDPRSGLSGYSSNAALLANWYMTNTEFGPGYDYATEIHQADLITAANDADVAVSLAAGGSEPRYCINGSFSTSEQPKAVLERMLAACAGTLVDLGDKWRVNMGVYHAPTVTLTERNLAGPSIINPYLAARDGANGAKGIFTNPNAKWQPDDFPAIEGSTFLSADGGKRQWLDMDLTAFVTSGTQAQRLAKIALFQRRQALSAEEVFNLAAWAAVPGRSVARTDAQLGWSAKEFEIVDSELTVAGDPDNPVLAVKHMLRETAAAIYDWSTSEEGIEDLAPNTNLPDPGEVAAPGTPAITEALYETRDGRGVAAKAIVSYAQSTYPFGPSYQLEYRQVGVSAWTVLPSVRVAVGSVGDVVQEILDVEPGRYDFRVQTVAPIGARSAYATTLNKEIIGLGATPAAPTITGLQSAGSVAILTLTQHAELDVRRGGRILARHSENASTATWEESFSIGDEQGYPGDSVVLVLPLKAGTYLLKAEDSTGQRSSAASISTKQASVLTFTLVSTAQEDTTYPGTHSNTIAVDGVLKLIGSGSFDSITDFDSVSSLDDFGGVSISGTYTFSAGHNFGAVSRRRLTGIIDGLTVNVNDLIDDRLANIDDWLDFDGTAGGGSADAFLEFRETDQDPTGSPTWSTWKRLDAAEVECWGTQYRVQMIAGDPAYNIHVDTLRVRADRL